MTAVGSGSSLQVHAARRPPDVCWETVLRWRFREECRQERIRGRALTDDEYRAIVEEFPL